jgi:hypothetical protein
LTKPKADLIVGWRDLSLKAVYNEKLGGLRLI